MQNKKSHKVAIVMGSQSDYSTMKYSINVLKILKIKYETKIVSAHRTPNRMSEYANSASKRGIKIIIAGAGGAAHLAGVMASLTTIPVIGVPIVSSNSIDGWDSLLSTVQMPSGIPVATVATNGAKNAGILAAQILGTSDNEISNKLRKFKSDLADKVVKDDSTL